MKTCVVADEDADPQADADDDPADALKLRQLN